MKRLKRYFLFLCLAPAFASPAKADDAPGSRLYWLLDPSHYAAENRSEKARLEACVSRLGLVDALQIIPDDRENRIAIEITNVLSIPITGLVLQPVDEQLAQLGLDGRTRIDFETIAPGNSFVYVENVADMPHGFSVETSVELVALDVVNIEGVEVVKHIFWSHWPLISSEVEFALAEQEFCSVHDPG